MVKTNLNVVYSNVYGIVAIGLRSIFFLTNAIFPPDFKL